MALSVYVLIRAQNVSVVDLQTNKVIGAPVKRWDVWPDDVSGGGDDGMYCAPLVSCRENVFAFLFYIFWADVLTFLASS